MPLTAAVGLSQALDGREAGYQAAQQVLDQFGRVPLLFGVVIASYDYPIPQVLAGIGDLFGNTPLFGFSTSGELSSKGQHQRSVIVAALAGPGIQVQADWWPGFSEDAAATAQKMAEAILAEPVSGSLLFSADGLGGDATPLINQLMRKIETGSFSVAGCLVGGDLRRGRAFQIGGQQAGNAGLGAAFFSGNIVMGVGASHGWQPAGSYFRVSKTRGLWIRMLDEHPAAEVYSQFFGYRSRDWGLPPLNELVRLYPLGIEERPSDSTAEEKQGTSSTYTLRSPLKMEADGSLRMNVPISEGSIAHLMIGSAKNCYTAAEQAARSALEDLKRFSSSARPALALLFVDSSWQMLLQADPGLEVHAVSEVLGSQVPILGGYTIGQVVLTGPNARQELLNQHITVILFAESNISQ